MKKIEIDELIKEAMHENNSLLLDMLKFIKAELLKKQTEPGHKTNELTEEELTDYINDYVTEAINEYFFEQCN